MMKKTDAVSTLELPLIVEKWQEDRLTKKYENARKIYNRMARAELNKLEQIKRTKIYKQEEQILKDLYSDGSEKAKETRKLIYQRRDEEYRKANFSEYGFNAEVKTYAKDYAASIPSNMAECTIAHPMWRAFHDLIFGDGKDIRYKEPGTMNTLQTNGKSGMRLCMDEKGYYLCLSNKTAKAKTMNIRVAEPKNSYEKEMISRKVKTIKLVRKMEKTKYHYYMQLTVAGSPAKKETKDHHKYYECERIHDIVGICIYGTRLYAVSSTNAKSFDLSIGDTMEKDRISAEINQLRIKLNPQNYKDGSIREGQKQWETNLEYRNLQRRYREINRIQREQGKIKRNQILNEILKMGDTFHVTMNTWNFKTKKSMIDTDKRKQKRKDIAAAAPAEFLEKLQNICEREGYTYERFLVPDHIFWYNHDTKDSDNQYFMSGHIVIEQASYPTTAYRAWLARYYDNISQTYRETELTTGFETIKGKLESV